LCGIVAYIGNRDSVPILLEGLARLEYRGYDSAGIAVISRGGELRLRKAKGRVAELSADVPARLKGSPGIGPTGWATHGEPSDENAHPHVYGPIAIVHNGIIENAEELRAGLIAAGAKFTSQTDSEIFAHLIAAQAGVAAGAGEGARVGARAEPGEGAQAGEGARPGDLPEPRDLEEAVRLALKSVVGTYGLAVLDARSPDRIVVARNGSPVLLGIGDKEMFAASDVAALVRYTRQVVHLDDGEIATLRADGFRTTTLDARQTAKQTAMVETDAASYDADGHAHFMHKEIHEQPGVIERVLRGRLDDKFNTAHLGGLNLEPRDARAIRRVKVLGCGSAYYSGVLGAQLIEELARIPADAEPASEFRYRSPVIEEGTLYIGVSQSGETYDTLAAVQEVKRKGGQVLGVINTVGSTIAREVDGGVYLHAGPEVSVTSTKTFTATATVFALLALHLARIHDLSPTEGRRISAGLRKLPGQIAEILAMEEEIASLAKDLAHYPGMFFLGRVRGWPVAREGAQKLKEVSYLHAEAYPASELKHGPLALVGPELPTVAIVPDDELLDKNLATLGEIKARRGRVLLVGHSDPGGELADNVLAIPKNEPELDPILLSVPLQLLAYHAAVALGNDVDRPRNLAKSVTVE
jgi:glutamine---fructose-6-phosphate transaminase (isomerizing)